MRFLLAKDNDRKISYKKYKLVTYQQRNPWKNLEFILNGITLSRSLTSDIRLIVSRYKRLTILSREAVVYANIPESLRAI
ncbi:hypothetical protein SK128_009642 [Halocaridina rubra]|uniref:Uncharacterized protein n=1 Tax=Halocaridina rubra TaxID=373956 RepID=A0AAN9A926_HALRR